MINVTLFEKRETKESTIYFLRSTPSLKKKTLSSKTQMNVVLSAYPRSSVARRIDKTSQNIVVFVNLADESSALFF